MLPTVLTGDHSGDHIAIRRWDPGTAPVSLVPRMVILAGVVAAALLLSASQIDDPHQPEPAIAAAIGAAMVALASRFLGGRGRDVPEPIPQPLAMEDLDRLVVAALEGARSQSDDAPAEVGCREAARPRWVRRLDEITGEAPPAADEDGWEDSWEMAAEPPPEAQGG